MSKEKVKVGINLSEMTPDQLLTIIENVIEAGGTISQSTFSHRWEQWKYDFRNKFEKEIEASMLLTAFFSIEQNGEDEEDFGIYAAKPIKAEGELKEFILDRTHGNWEDYHDTCRVLFMHCSEVHSRSNGPYAYSWLGFGFKSRHSFGHLSMYVPEGYVLKEN